MRSFGCVLAGLALLACGPVVMIPGGELSGTLKPPPQDWSFSESIETVQLETNPGDPYSVNVWGIGVGSVFYVAAGDSESQWAKNIATDSRVRLRLGDDIYELNATRTDAEEELETFLAAAKQKYDFEPDPEQREQAALFRLSPR